jgi:hypothetical protein
MDCRVVVTFLLTLLFLQLPFRCQLRMGGARLLQREEGFSWFFIFSRFSDLFPSFSN